MLLGEIDFDNLDFGDLNIDDPTEPEKSNTEEMFDSNIGIAEYEYEDIDPKDDFQVDNSVQQVSEEDSTNNIEDETKEQSEEIKESTEEESKKEISKGLAEKLIFLQNIKPMLNNLSFKSKKSGDVPLVDLDSKGKLTELKPVKIMIVSIFILSVILCGLLVFIIIQTRNRSNDLQNNDQSEHLVDYVDYVEEEIEDNLILPEEDIPDSTVALDLELERESIYTARVDYYMPTFTLDYAVGTVENAPEQIIYNMALTDGKRLVLELDSIIQYNYLASENAQALLNAAFTGYSNDSVARDGLINYIREMVEYQYKLSTLINKDSYVHASGYITAYIDYVTNAKLVASNMFDYLRYGSNNFLTAVNEHNQKLIESLERLNRERRSYLLGEGFTEEELSNIIR